MSTNWKPRALPANLFDAMGSDLGSFHASSPDDADAIKQDLRDERHGNWLHQAADRAEEQVCADFTEWKQLMEAKKPADDKKKKTMR